MQVHKIVLIVTDYFGLGQRGVIDALEDARYPNCYIAPKVLTVDTRDCGEWSDDHPLNNRSTADAEMSRLFGA